MIERPGGPTGGFTVLELLIAMAITLVVMAGVFQITQQIGRLYRTQSASIEKRSAAVRALDDIVHEIYLSGRGLGEGIARALPYEASAGESLSSGIALRSNPEGIAMPVPVELSRGTAVPVGDASLFHKGDTVLVIDGHGTAERARVEAAETSGVALSSLDSEDGEFLHSYSPASAARLLKLREVLYYLRPSADGTRHELVKEEVGLPPRVLAPDTTELHFDYLDADSEPVAAAPTGHEVALAALRVRLAFKADVERDTVSWLATSVVLPASSTDIRFDEPSPGLRLARVYFPLTHPAAVGSPPAASWGVVLGAGDNPVTDPAYLFTFPLLDTFLGAQTENVVPLEDVRSPIAFCFGPEGTALEGSLFLTAAGLRRGHLARVYPDSHGTLSAASRVLVFEGTEELARAGGLAFGIDGALYISSLENAALFRYRFDAEGKPRGPERISRRLPGAPGSVALGPDGSIVFLVETEAGGELWRLPFDPTLSPQAPEKIAVLPGHAVALAADPLATDLYALVREERGDSVVVSLSRVWLRAPSGSPPEVFRRSRFRADIEAGRLPPRSVSLHLDLLPQAFDLLSFDADGLLYIGSGEGNIILKFDLARPDARLYSVGLAGVVVQGQVRLHAWKKGRPGP